MKTPRNAHDSSFTTEMILDRATAITHGELEGTHPMVLSCGGIFVPRPKPIHQDTVLYEVINRPGECTGAKVVNTVVSEDLLELISSRDRLN
jgi:hypothetical protein